MQVLELAAPIEILPSRQTHLARNCGLRIGNHASYVTATHVRLHHDTPLAVLAADLVGTIGDADVGHALKRHEPAVRQRYRDLTERLQIGACHIRQADGDGEPPIALEDHTSISATDRSRDRVLHSLRGDTEPRHDVAARLNVEHGQALGLLHPNVNGAFRLAQHGRNGIGCRIHGVGVVAEHLHREVAAHAGD